MSLNSWNRALYEEIYFEEQATPSETSFMMSGCFEMSILIMGEILDMFPYSNTSDVGMGFLNQTLWPIGREFLASTTQMALVGA